MFSSNGRHRAARMLFVSLSAAAGVCAQEVPQFKVELKSDQLLISPNYVCELEEYRTHQRAGVAELGSDDTFVFRGVATGDYQLTVSDRRGDVIVQEPVMVTMERSTISVRLPAAEKHLPPSGPVSFAQLQHPPARKAFSAMLAAQRFSEAGDYRRAAEQLQKAIRISPDYGEAYANLAVQHIRLGQYELAIEELTRASQFIKPAAPQLSNLAYAQMQLKQYDAATESVRAALRLDANYAQAHYLLGAMLARNPKTLGDALPHLEIAAKSLPSAETMLAAAQNEWKTLTVTSAARGSAGGK